MRVNWASVLSSVLCIVGGSLAAQAATVTQFNFNTSGSPTTVAANVTSTAVANAGLNAYNASTNFSAPNNYATNVLSAAPSSAGTGYGATSGGPTVNLTNPTAQSNLAATNSYFAFTVTPDSGYEMSLTSVTLLGARGGNGTPRGVAIYSVIGSGTPVFHGAADFTTVRPTLNSYSFTLTGLTGVTTAVTFRVYVFAPGIGNTVEIDDLTLNGSVGRTPLVEIPLPAASLAGGGLLAAALFRRGR